MELFEKVYEKLRNGYYHKNSVYKTDKTFQINYECLECDHLELLMDLTECNVDIDLNEYIWNDTVDCEWNIIYLMKLIRKFDESKEHRKALIHLGIYFIMKEEDIINYLKINKSDIKISEQKGKTLYDWNLRNYLNDQYFKQVCDNWDNFLKENTHTK
jgi:hypothetical protein